MLLGCFLSRFNLRFTDLCTAVDARLVCLCLLALVLGAFFVDEAAEFVVGTIRLRLLALLALGIQLVFLIYCSLNLLRRIAVANADGCV